MTTDCCADRSSDSLSCGRLNLRSLGDCGTMPVQQDFQDRRHNDRVTQLSVEVHRRFRPVVGLSWVGGFFAGGLTLSIVYATTGLGVACPFRALTGWDCPLCGGTRMGAALLHGDVVSAFLANPLALIGVVVVGLLGAVWTIEVVGGPAIRAPRAVSDPLRRLPRIGWVLLAVALAIGYTLARNLF